MMPVVSPAPFHPWGFKANHDRRKDFESEAAYWRYWAERLKLSTAARLRLEWLIFYSTVGKRNGKLTAQHFGIARQIFGKWKNRFNPNNLVSLEDHSRAPRRRRTWTVTCQQEKRIIHLRNQHLKWGKEKLKHLFLQTYREDISTNKIQKVINKHQLYPEPETHQRKVRCWRKRKPKVYIHTFNKQRELGFLWHTDTIIIWWYGVRRVIFTALEELTKIGYARVYTTNSSRNAKDFLERLVYLSNHQVVNIHHDHGSEFAKDFEKACRQLGINQIFSRVRTPKDNAALERFNWTVQAEWLSLSEWGLDDIREANQDLTEWLVEYNGIRPHQSLDYQAPLTYAQQQFQVSPMWSARTNL